VNVEGWDVHRIGGPRCLCSLTGPSRSQPDGRVTAIEFVQQSLGGFEEYGSLDERAMNQDLVTRTRQSEYYPNNQSHD
jgi:hypothetical protein